MVALTCIDPRLNHLLPEVLGIPEAQFIWLRNSGNIIFDPMSSMMRTLALACAVKGGKEIAIIGHTDCHVRKTSMVELTDRFKALGIDRARLPENLNEFFGLFASERQNVIRGVEFVRSSPLIGPKIPVHGLIVEVQTGKLEWVVNGYEKFASVTAAGSEVHLEAKLGGKDLLDVKLNLPAFHVGEMKFPEFKIGDLALHVESKPATPSPPETKQPETKQPAPVHSSQPDWQRIINQALKYKIIGADQKQYGPISGAKLLEWLADERINEQTPVQVEGSSLWRTLADLTHPSKPPTIPIPQRRPFTSRPPGQKKP